MSQTIAEIAESLGLQPDTPEHEVRIAQARAIGDDELVAELEAAQTAAAGSEAALADASPPAPGDTSAPAGSDASEPPAGPPAPRGRLTMPDDTNGHYVVLWAPKPPRKTERPEYREVDVVRASDSLHARRLVIGDAKRADYTPAHEAFLKAQAEATRGGILLRAVPAMHWPRDVEPTTYVRPEPVLRVG